jgi:anti-sigma B factor antagonist
MVNFEKRNSIDIVTFSIDRINALIADEIREKIARLFENANSQVVINLKGVQYIDSSGFGCFLSLFRVARDSYGVLKFAEPEPNVRALFETLNLHTVFEIFPDTESCIRSLK